MADGDAKKWFKYGCLGCLGCLGLLLAAIAVVVGLAWMRAKSEDVKDEVLTHPVSAAAAPSAPSAARAPGKVVLDLSGAEFSISRGAEGDPIRVDASYDHNSFSLDPTTEQAADGSWTYRVEFRATKSSWVEGLQRAFSGSQPTVRVTLPPGIPFSLETKVERGALVADLGGLRLTSASIHVSMGALGLSFSEPLPEPMERLEVKMEMGGGELGQIGNASPRVLDVEYRMGGVQLDLRGAWRADAEIGIRGSMGGGQVRLPRDARIEGVPGRGIEAPDTSEIPRPTLRFTTSAGTGELKFD